MRLFEHEPKPQLEKDWGNYVDMHSDRIRQAILKSIASAFETNYGFIVVRKDRYSGYRVEHKQWPDVLETLKELGAIGGHVDKKKRGEKQWEDKT